MTAAEILLLPVQSKPRRIRATDTGVYYLIDVGQSGADAQAQAPFNHAASHRPNGADAIVPLDNSTNAAPSSSNDATQGYSPGSQWTNTTTGVVSWCMSNTAGAAVWIQELTAGDGYRTTREIWQRRMGRKDSRYVQPSIEAFKLASPPFLDRARVIAGDVRVLVIGNSYSAEAWPQKQFEERFASISKFGSYSAPQAVLNAGTATFAGGTTNTGGQIQTLVPQQDGYINIPSGGTATISGTATGFQLGYVQESGAGTLAIEVSADDGSTWTHYTDSVNANGSLAYLNAKNPSAWTRGHYAVRLTASGGSVKVGFFALTGNLVYHLVNTGGATDYVRWSAVANDLDAGTIESWYADWDPDFVFVRYSNDQALSAYWSEFVTRITAACPNAQIIVTGEHSNGTQTTRDSNDGTHARRNDSLRVACSALPNFSFIDCWNWLPNFADAYALNTMNSPDTVHLNTTGGDIVRALQWECLRPWVFPKASQPTAANNYRARTIFETSGWQQTAILQNDFSVSDSTNADTVTNRLVQFSGLDPQGWYELEMMVRITSNSTVRAKIGLQFVSATAYNNNRDGWFWNNAGTIERLQPPTSGNPGSSFPASAFSAGGSSIIYHSRQTFQLNDLPLYIVNKRGIVRVNGAQGSSSATAVVFVQGSVFRLRKINQPSYGGSYHRDLLPP